MPAEQILATPCKCTASCVCDDRANCSCNQSDNFDLQFYKDQLTTRALSREFAEPDSPAINENSDDNMEAGVADEGEPGPEDAVSATYRQVLSEWSDYESDLDALQSATDGAEADEDVSETEWTEGDAGEATDTSDSSAKPKKDLVRGPYNKHGAKYLALAKAGKGMSTRQACAAANYALKVGFFFNFRTLTQMDFST